MSEAHPGRRSGAHLDSSPTRSKALREQRGNPGVVALIPQGGSFEGQVALQGETRVEGAVRGSLRGSGELVLGQEARVEGLVECDVVSSNGVIIGPVAARVRAFFGDGAHFEGDLDAPTVVLEGDVIWNGVARVGG